MRLGYFDAIHTRADGQQQSAVYAERTELGGLVAGASERYLGDEYQGTTTWAQGRALPRTRLGYFDSVHTGADGRQDSAVGGTVGKVAGRRAAMTSPGR